MFFVRLKKDPFVKIYMLYRGLRVEKMQTKIVEQSRSPVFDQSFEFSLLSIIQQSQPMDNVAFVDSNEASNSDLAASSSQQYHHLEIDSKIASRIQFILLVMDWDQVEKSDVLGKIELNTQHHQQRLLSFQSMQDNNNSNATTSSSLGAKHIINTNTNSDVMMETKVDAETDLAKLKQQNWYDIFYQPNLPILCTFQIDNY